MGNIQNPTENDQTGVATRLPWVERTALAFLRGDRVGLAERDRDEVLAILGVAVELVTARTRRRPCAKRRAA